MLRLKMIVCSVCLLVSGCAGATNDKSDLNVITCFFTGDWKKGGFSGLEKELHASEILKKKYHKINTIDVRLGTGSKIEELRNGWKVVKAIKKSFKNNEEIKNIVKLYGPGKKINTTIVASSVSAVLVRCAWQKYGHIFPFALKHFISICAPQVGIFSVPPEKYYKNPVEQACSEVQKFTTDGILGGSKSSPDNPLKPNWILWGGNALFGTLASMAYLKLYQESVQDNWISLWRDPYQFSTYQSCGGKNKPPFLPFFNNELSKSDAKKYAEDLGKYRKNLGLVDHFDFIASKNDEIILKETALCQEQYVESKTLKYHESGKFLERVGIDAEKVKFHLVDGARHRCHSSSKIIKKVVECIGARP